MTAIPRILYLVNAFEMDAPTGVSAALGLAMKRAGWEVAFVAWSRGGIREKNLVSSGAPTHVLKGRVFEKLVTLRRILAEFKADIVHTALARPILATAAVRAFTVRGSVIWIASDHGTHEWHEKGSVRGRVMEAVMPRILSSMDAVVSVSRSAQDELRNRGVWPEEFRMIYNGVDILRFRCPPERNPGELLAASFPKERSLKNIVLVGSAGNLRNLKGYDDLIEAIPKVLKRVPGARFIIWGEGPELDRLRKKAEQFQVDFAIRFLGFENRLEEHLPLLDIYVQPSRIESFGLAAAEAMACCVPTVVSNAGGLNELVEDRISGTLYSSGDSEALAMAIANLAEAPAVRKEMGFAGRRRIVANFSLDQLEAEFFKLYVDLLSKRVPE